MCSWKISGVYNGIRTHNLCDADVYFFFHHLNSLQFQVLLETINFTGYGLKRRTLQKGRIEPVDSHFPVYGSDKVQIKKKFLVGCYDIFQLRHG